MTVTLLVVGRIRGKLADVAAGYEERAARYWKLEVVEVEAGAPGSGKAGPERVRKAEGERILDVVGEGATIVALTRRGKAMTSVQLARFLQKAAVGSVPEVAFVIGGAYGLSPAVLKSADRRISISAMTLPHEVARVVLTEQLYRAGTIVRGEPYHKGTKR